MPLREDGGECGSCDANCGASAQGIEETDGNDTLSEGEDTTYCRRHHQAVAAATLGDNDDKPASSSSVLQQQCPASKGEMSGDDGADHHVHVESNNQSCLSVTDEKQRQEVGENDGGGENDQSLSLLVLEGDDDDDIVLGSANSKRGINAANSSFSDFQGSFVASYNDTVNLSVLQTLVLSPSPRRLSRMVKNNKNTMLLEGKSSTLLLPLDPSSRSNAVSSPHLQRPTLTVPSTEGNKKSTKRLSKKQKKKKKKKKPKQKTKDGKPIYDKLSRDEADERGGRNIPNSSNQDRNKTKESIRKDNLKQEKDKTPSMKKKSNMKKTKKKTKKKKLRRKKEQNLDDQVQSFINDDERKPKIEISLEELRALVKLDATKRRRNKEKERNRAENQAASLMQDSKLHESLSESMEITGGEKSDAEQEQQAEDEFKSYLTLLERQLLEDEEEDQGEIDEQCRPVDDDDQYKPSGPHKVMSLEEIRAAVVLDAAKMGRLVRYEEHFVETATSDDDASTSGSSSASSDESWTVKTGAQTQISRSPHFRIINEAAFLAQMKFKQDMEDGIDESSSADSDSSGSIDDDETPQWKKRASKAMAARKCPSGVVEGHVNSHITTKQQEHQNLTPAQILEREDQKIQNEIPTSQIPVFKTKRIYLTKKQLRSCIPHEVAEASRKRQDRLQKYHAVDVKTNCNCKYCKNPSAVQTETYQRLRIRKLLLSTKGTTTAAFIGPTSLIEAEKRTMERSAILVQAFVRGSIWRGSVRRMLQKRFIERSVVKIQAFVRGSICRGAVSAMLAELIETLLS